MEEWDSILDQDRRSLVLVREGANHDPIDCSVRVLAAVENYLGVRLGRDGEVGHFTTRALCR